MISLLAAAVFLQSSGSWIGGTIVDVRGDIIQIRPRRQSGLTRVVVGKNALIQRGEVAPLSTLKPGDVVFARGEYKEGGPFRCVYMEEGEGNDGKGGLQADSYSQLFVLNGTVTSNSPLVIKDEKGKVYNVEDKNCRLIYDVTRDRSAITTGQMAFFHGKKTPDGLTDVDIAWVDGTGQNSDSTLVGKVITNDAGKISLKNQFQTAPTDLTIPTETAVYILNDVRDSSVKIGSQVYIQSDLIPKTDSSPEAKLAKFIGIGADASIPFSSDDPMIKTVEFKGTLESLFPCRVRTISGEVVSFVVPGQAQIASVIRGKTTDIRVGDDLQVAGTETPDKFSIKYVLVRRKAK